MNKSTLPELISPYFFLNEKFYDEVKPANFPNTIIRYRNKNFEVREGEEEIADFTQQISSITFYEGLIAIKKNTRPKPHILKNFKE